MKRSKWLFIKCYECGQVFKAYDKCRDFKDGRPEMCNVCPECSLRMNGEGFIIDG